MDRRRLLLLGLSAVPTAAAAQNLVEDAGSSRTAPAIQLAPADLELLLRNPQTVSARPDVRIAAKLEAHVRQLLDRWPLRPFQNTLGISGYEVYFDHPDRLFYSLALAQPHLSPALRAKVRGFLAARMSEKPPYAVEGYDRSTGAPRESYEVPDELWVCGGGSAQSAFGVYAMWLASLSVLGRAGADLHWPTIRARLKRLAAVSYRFDLRKRDYDHDEAQQLNGDLAGLIGGIRLCRDKAFEAQLRSRALELLELRVNLERVNPRILEKTSSTSKHLHVNKLARYCNLVPEVGQALRIHTEGLAAERLRVFREARNGWCLAFGDRFIGGENYTSPPHLCHALFNGAALVERVPAKELAAWIDVPWCRGDLYFIEKCALALRSAEAV